MGCGTASCSLMAVEVEPEPTFKFGTSKILFNPEDISLGYTAAHQGNFDISPVDKRFLMIKPAAVTPEESIEESVAELPRKIIIVTNWFEELKEKVLVD